MTKKSIQKSKKFDHSKAPLYEALCLYEETNHISMHVPGHKDGRVFDKAAQHHFSNILKIDATCIKGIDDLHQPTGSILEAQSLAADAFGADQTFFLVGGSTIGNLAIAQTVAVRETKSSYNGICISRYLMVCYLLAPTRFT